MAVRNQLTDKYEATRKFPSGHSYVGVGETKEKANEALRALLKENEASYGPFKNANHEFNVKRMIKEGKLPKYQHSWKVVGQVKSPGFEMVRDTKGNPIKYVFNENKTTLVKGIDLRVQTKEI